MQIRELLVRRILPVVVLTAAASATARADISFSFTQGDLAAEAVFHKNGSNLEITLKNLSGVHVGAAEEILTGVFFDFAGVLTAIDATAVTLAGILNAGTSFNGVGHNGLISGFGYDIGVEVGYSPGASGLNPNVGDHAIGHVGMDDFMGEDTRFDMIDANNLQSSLSPNGMEYGIVNPGYDGSGNHPLNVPGPQVLLDTWVTYVLAVTLPGGGGGWSTDDISNVSFNYGTEFNPIPAPGAALLGVFGLAAVSSMKRRLS